MASSVYISQNLTKEQFLFLQLLDESEIDYFSIKDIEKRVKYKFANLNEVLENLARKNVLIRLQKGYYAKRGFNNQYVIGTFIAKNSAVAYWSALNLHGLTSRFPNIVFIQTVNRKRNVKILGINYKFVVIPKRKQIGITKMGYGNNSFPITDVEKTIIDCFDLPRYSGGIDLLVAAFAQAELDENKMIQYAEAVNNISVTKRIGFLAELLNKEGLRDFIEYAKEKVNGSYSLIDPSGEKQGEFVPEWKVRLNISRDKILNLANELY